MFLAVPILVLVTFIMARLMFHLALNALPVAAAVAAFFVVRSADGTLVQALLAAGGVALAITAFAHIAIRHLTNPLARGLVLLSFCRTGSRGCLQCGMGRVGTGRQHGTLRLGGKRRPLRRIDGVAEGIASCRT